MSTAIRALVPTKLASLNLLVAANECRRMSRYNTTSTSVGRMTALQHFSVVEEIERGFQWCGANERKLDDRPQQRAKVLLDIVLNDESFLN